MSEIPKAIKLQNLDVELLNILILGRKLKNMRLNSIEDLFFLENTLILGQKWKNISLNSSEDRKTREHFWFWPEEVQKNLHTAPCFIALFLLVTVFIRFSRQILK